VKLTTWDVIKRSYAGAWKFVSVLPLIAAVTTGVECLQHVVEFLDGMYRDAAGMRAHANDAGRLAAGVLKVSWLLMLEYWVARFVVSQSARVTLIHDATAIRKFAVVMAAGSAMVLTQLFLPIILRAAHISALVSALILLLVFVLLFVPQIILTPWSVSAALGDPRASFDFASRRSEGSRLWAVIVCILTALPLLAVHYVLGYAAVGRPTPEVIGMLAVDAVVVGFLGLVLSACGVMVAQRMAYLDGEALTCGPFASHIPRSFGL